MSKSSILRLFVSLIIIFFLGCDKKTPKGINKVVVSGIVVSPHQNKIHLSNAPVPLENEWLIAGDTTGIHTIIDDDGNFRFEIEIEKPDFYRINYGNKSVNLYLNPNDSVSVTLDSIMKVGGSNGHLNDYLQKHKIELGKSEGYIYKNLTGLYASKESEFQHRLDSLKNYNLNNFNLFLSDAENTPLAFREGVIANIDYLFKYFKLLYPLGHESVTGNKVNLAENFFNELSVGLDSPQFLNNEKYTAYLDKYVEIMSAGDFKYERYDDQPLEKIRARYDVIKELSVDQKIKDYLFEQHFKLCKQNYSTKHWKVILGDFKENNQNETLYAEIARAYQDSFSDRQEPDVIQTYKTIDNIELDAHVFFPEGHQKKDKKAAYLYFHGGGWSLGMPEAGYNNCKRMAEKGMVAISFEYRLIDVHGNIIQKGLEDAKSAIRWVRSQASELGVDPDRIVAAGFSAGAHLAASTAIVEDFVSEDNNNFSSKPNLVITQSSSYDLTKSDWFDGVSGGQAQSVSLLQNIKSDLPPFLLLHTTEDYLAPVHEFFQFKAAMETHKNDFQFQVFEGVGHFFRDKEAREKAKNVTDKFLKDRGYLMGEKE